MGTLAYATAIAAAVIIGSVAAEITAEASSTFVFELFNNYMWHPPGEATANAPRPIGLLAHLAIED